MRSAPPVMILGCGRSGTSIFGELFEHMPIYHYRSEPPFEAVMSADFSRPQAFKVPRESTRFGEAGPGLSFPLATIQAYQPTMRFFWIVRHPLDTIASLRVGIAQNWGHHPRPPDWRSWLDRPVLERCAHHWAFLNEHGFAQVEDVATLVTFERMIAEPQRFAVTICQHLDIDPGGQAAPLAAWAKTVQDTNNEDFVEARTSRGYSRPDHTRRVGRWRENLSPEEVERLWPVVADVAARFGYEQEG